MEEVGQSISGNNESYWTRRNKRGVNVGNATTKKDAMSWNKEELEWKNEMSQDGAVK